MKPVSIATASPGSQVSQHDVIEQVSEPLTLAPGHRLQQSRCLVCASRIGGMPFRIYALIDFRAPACYCGGCGSASWLICAGHGTDDNGALMLIALARWKRHHESRS